MQKLLLLQISKLVTEHQPLETARQRGRLGAAVLAGLTGVHIGKGREFTTCCTVNTIKIFFFRYVLYHFVAFWAMLCLYLCRTSDY